MLVTLSGMVTLVRLVQLENADPDAGDAVADVMLAGQISFGMRTPRCW